MSNQATIQVIRTKTAEIRKAMAESARVYYRPGGKDTVRVTDIRIDEDEGELHVKTMNGWEAVDSPLTELIISR